MSNPTTPVRNLDYIRSKDERLYEALTDIITHYTTVGQQTNANPTGQPSAPPAVQGLTVTAQNGHFTASIADQNTGVYRDVRYFIEHADNPHFTNPHIIDNGTSRDWHGFMGNVTRYFRAYSAYGSSPAGPPAYHGSQTQPIAVQGGGSNGGPAFLPSQGSGTGSPGQGLSGPGPVPFRSETGAAPVRGK